MVRIIQVEECREGNEERQDGRKNGSAKGAGNEANEEEHRVKTKRSLI